VLVQRTAWHNAEQALAAMRPRGLLAPDALAAADSEALKALIRPAGFVNAKARYLQALAAFVVDSGGLAELSNLSTAALRARLLAVHGVGPETADSILLYLFDRPVWISDAYAARVFTRVSGAAAAPGNQDALLESWCSDQRTQDIQELHALIVAHGKAHCRAAPRCYGCPLLGLCVHGARAMQSAS
jgi:endonuclease-3 related protein